MTRRYPQPPQDWQFSEGAREEHAGYFWRLPVRTVTGGLWGDVWRTDESTRGGGTASSILPVLAAHVWPSKKSPYGGDPNGLWTPWAYLSTRRLSRLAGVCTDTVTTACNRLEGLELLQRQTAPPPPHHGGPTRRLFRLASALYPTTTDLFAKIPAALFYHGHWAMLPLASARHLYVALAALDPVLDEASYAGGEETDRILEARARAPHSLGQLAEITGLRRSTVQEALAVLKAPLFRRGGPASTTKPDLPMVDSGPAAGGQALWYAPSRVALTWYWHAETLQTSAAIAATQAQYWPVLAGRRVDAANRKRLAGYRSEQRRRHNAGKKAAQTRRERAEQALNRTDG